MIESVTRLRHRGSGVAYDWFLVPWDTAIFGYAVAQIDTIEILDESKAADDFSCFRAWCDDNCIRLVGCRLPHDSLRESMYLESEGFRFVEMVLHPIAKDIHVLQLPASRLQVNIATDEDIPLIRDIAGRAFRFERYHVDPRLQRDMANLRYREWVGNAMVSERQQILVVRHGELLVGFFIWERVNNDTAYWHLTAISPDCQGRGYGREAWAAVISHHRVNGIRQLRTTISIRNVPVLNLYASLGFRFDAPEMTFHWLRTS